MREVGDDLHILTEPEGTYLIKHERKYDKSWKQQYIFHKANDEGIAKNLLEARATEDYPKILQSYKWPITPGSELEESQTHVYNWQYSEQKEKNERRE